MVEGSGTAREISLGEDFGDVVVKVNGALIAVRSDGTAKKQSAPTEDNATPQAKAALTIRLRRGFGGEVGVDLDDGTIYAALSPKPDESLVEQAVDLVFGYSLFPNDDVQSWFNRTFTLAAQGAVVGAALALVGGGPIIGPAMTIGAIAFGILPLTTYPHN
jgi:hypothetical protein